MNGAANEHERGADDLLFTVPSVQVAAHELKAPLTLIRQLSQAIAVGGYDSDQIALLASRIGFTSERALRLTTDLTKTARLEEAMFQLEPIDAVPLCRDVVSELAPLYRARGRDIYMPRRQKAVPLVIAHRDLLRRIMLNFADNALHHTEDTRPVELKIAYRRKADAIRLSVRDYGPGLSRSFRAHIAKQQLPPQVPYRPASSGLGLYIAQQFASTMGAQTGIVAHRDGASFYVDVPRSTQLGLWQ